uniref:Uncharacterized protein n=1 Tax=Oryzias latipes TaxID=8090 RepID=A0A3B3HE89_ORYLA
MGRTSPQRREQSPINPSDKAEECARACARAWVQCGGLFFPETPWRAAFPHFVFIMVLADLSAPVSSSLIPELSSC